jgi:diguanylate cyclase
MGRVSTGVRAHAASRAASVVLGLTLLAVCATALTASFELNRATQTAEAAVTASDLYQQARYYSVAESDALGSYLLTQTPALRDEYETLSSGLDDTLQVLQKTPSAQADDEQTTLTSLLWQQTQYETLARRTFTLTVRQRLADARALYNAEMAPLTEQIQSALKALEDRHGTDAARDLDTVTREGQILRIGTPAVLGVALLALALLGLVKRRHRRAIEKQAVHDALTGLPNRTLFMDRARQALSAAARSGAEPVVMVMDLDQFKEVNDTLGHHFGDQLLVELADRLTTVMRPSDTIARFGGDEFAVLLVAGGREAGARVAERMAAALEEPFDLDGVCVGIEASIGIATYAVEDESSRDLSDQVAAMVRRADTAMYAAKADRSGYAHYTIGHEDGSPNRLAILGDLRQALDRGDLVAYFQPKVAADSGDLVGVEALARWQHPTRGLLLPADFIALAESTTLIHRITTHMLDQSLAFTREQLDRGRELPVSVNVSTRCLLDPSFPASVAARLDSAGVPGSMLCLEITESTIMVDPDRALAVLRELHDMGVRLSVDDFGTGYSSMAYLKILPVDELKVDRTFVRDMAANTALVQSAVDLGHNLGLAVVAEGVEDGVTLVALQEVGADVVQGYYTGRPMAPEALRSWLSARSLTRS